MLANGGPVDQALPGETGEVDRLEASFQQELGQCAPPPGNVHEAVSGEPRQHVEVAEPAGARPDDDVAVEVVLVVEPGDRAQAARLVELGETVGQRGPDDGLEVPQVDVEVEPARLCERRYSPGIALSFGSKGETIEILDVGERLDRLRSLEVVLKPSKRLDRHVDVDHLADVLRPPAGGVDEMFGFDLISGDEPGRDDDVAGSLEPG